MCIMFKQKHSEETKKKISNAMKGKKHPRSGAEWTDEQRLKYSLTIYDKQQREQALKMFLIKHNSEWTQFQKSKL